MPENVLVVVFDTARADAFEPYGADRGSTPAVTQLAGAGEAVPDVFSTACWTLPSHASMFTGRLPRALGLTQAPDGTPHGARPVMEANRDRLLPEVLRRSGYDTRAASANVWVSPAAGFDIGFDEFEVVDNNSRMEQVERGTLQGRLTWPLEGLRARQDDGAAGVERTLRRWVGERSADKPFFWFVNLIEAHSPYLPPKPYNDLGPLDRMRAANEARRHLTLMEIWRTCLTDFEPPPAALERMRHLYARSIQLLDDWLARVLEVFDEQGLLDDTLVIVTSDHGENFGEGGLLAHAFSLDDRLIRVPFVVNREGFVPADGGMSLAELPRLLADHLGLDDHPWVDDLPHGCAAAQFDFIERGDSRVQVALDMWDMDEAGIERMTTPLTCASDGRFKLLRRGEVEELYDLGTDPLEAAPIEPGDDARVAELRAALDSPAVQQMHAAAAAPVEASAEELEEIEQRMKLLGYL
jgi:Sulfatase